jgi:hypothetical protein
MLDDVGHEQQVGRVGWLGRQIQSGIKV